MGDVPVQVGLAASLNPSTGIDVPPQINWPNVGQCNAGGGIGGFVQHCVGYLTFHPGNCFGYYGTLTSGGLVWAGVCSGPGELLFCMGQASGGSWWEHCTGVRGTGVEACEYRQGSYTSEGGVHQRTTTDTTPLHCRAWNVDP